MTVRNKIKIRWQDIPNDFTVFEREEAYQVLEEALGLSGITPKQKTAFILREMGKGKKKPTFLSISKEMGLSPSRGRQLYVDGVMKLRKYILTRTGNDFTRYL